MKRWIVGTLAFILAGCYASTPPPAIPTPEPPPTRPPADTAAPAAADLPVIGPAPELTNEIWLNTDRPLRLADLRGKVVLLDMWTFGCINCQHVIPSLKQWHETYSSQGLVVIGNHFPEFERERDLDNLKEAVREFGISYPVAQDNNGRTWSAYNNSYWPTLYLIDKQGRIRYQYIGEGAYEQTEAAIQALLAETS